MKGPQISLVVPLGGSEDAHVTMIRLTAKDTAIPDDRMLIRELLYLGEVTNPGDVTVDQLTEPGRSAVQGIIE